MKILSNTKFIIISLFAITLIAYGQTLRMFFWIDDFALIYKLQRVEEAIGYWGRGVIGEGPYRHIIDQFVPFYPIFGTNPEGYFAIGILLYFLASVTLYYFVRLVTKNKLIAFASASIFAAGYIGSESMFGITNSWQTPRGIIMALITFILYYKFIKSRNFVFYILSVVLFFFSLDTVFVRAHGLIFAIIAFDILFWPVKLKISPIAKLFLRQLPFAFIYYHIYLSSLSYAQEFGILKLLEEIFIKGKYFLTTFFVQDIGNLFIPDPFTAYVDKMGISIGSILAGMLFIGVFLFLILRNLKTSPLLIRFLVFSAVFITANFIVFYAREPEHTLWSTHRYFSYPFVGLAIFWGTGLSLALQSLNKQKLFLPLAGLIVTTYLVLGWNYQSSFNEKRSIPTRNFYDSFRTAIPGIPKGAIIYFDTSNDTNVKNEFNSFFGGMLPERANLTIFSTGINYPEWTLSYDFEEVHTLLKENGDLNNLYTFYYGEEGLVDTTPKVHELLTTGKTIELDSVFTEPPNVEISLPQDTPSYVPATFEFSMKVIPKSFLDLREDDSAIFSLGEKALILSYLSSQNNFQKFAKVASGSFWKDQEPKYASDGRLDTAWRGHRGFWNEISRGNTNNIEFLSIDLGEVKNIGQMRWVSGQKPLLPTHYRILASFGGRDWKLVKDVINRDSKPEGTVIVDSFEGREARYIKLEILETYGDDGPEIAELEVVETRFVDLDRAAIERVRENPFGGVKNILEYQMALSYVRNNAKSRLYFMSDADKKQDPTKYAEVPLFVGDLWHNYKIELPATGTSWTKFTLQDFNFRREVFLGDIKLMYKKLE